MRKKTGNSLNLFQYLKYSALFNQPCCINWKYTYKLHTIGLSILIQAVIVEHMTHIIYPLYLVKIFFQNDIYFSHHSLQYEHITESQSKYWSSRVSCYTWPQIHVSRTDWGCRAGPCCPHTQTGWARNPGAHLNNNYWLRQELKKG